MSKTKLKNQNIFQNFDGSQQHPSQSYTNFSTNWDVEKYRREYESEEHWLLRKRFMDVHKNRFPEDKLVCLAQVFINMEFLGCKYPAETMHMVGELSKEVAREFRAGRENRLKRTFVTASDAAEARVKGHKPTQPAHHVQPSSSFQDNNITSLFNFGDYEIMQPIFKMPSSPDDLFEGLMFGKFVLHLQGDRNCLRVSAQRSRMEYFEKELNSDSGRKGISIYIDNYLVASACEENIKTSKAEAFRKALAILQDHCYSIKLNPSRDTIKIQKTNNKIICDVIKTEDEDEQKIDVNNKGYRMMKMMGWSGGGLGSQKQGREDPVGYLLKSNRAGLGNDTDNLDRTYFAQILKNYVDSDDIRDLQFEPTFTKEERVMLHEIANKFNLKSASQTARNPRQRCLIINKKTISDIQILEEVLIKRSPRYKDRYFIQVPKSKSLLFPEYTVPLTL